MSVCRLLIAGAAVLFVGGVVQAAPVEPAEGPPTALPPSTEALGEGQSFYGVTHFPDGSVWLVGFGLGTQQLFLTSHNLLGAADGDNASEFFATA